MRVEGGHYFFLIVVAFFFAPIAANAGADSEQKQCLDRLVRAECPANREVQKFILSKVDQCHHLSSASGDREMEVLVLRQTHHLVLVETKGLYHWPGYCRVTRYSVSSDGIRDFKVISDREGQKAWLVSKSGQLYCVSPDQRIFEVLNNDGDHYQQLRAVEPMPGASGIRLIGKDRAPCELTTASLSARSKRWLNTPDPYWSLSPISAGIQP